MFPFIFVEIKIIIFNDFFHIYMLMNYAKKSHSYKENI